MNVPASNYPDNWPRCIFCGEPVLDGHLTCGSVNCPESIARSLHNLNTMNEAMKKAFAKEKN